MLLQGLLFLAVILTVVFGLHWYVYKRLVKDTTRPGRVRRAGLIALLTLSGALLLTIILPRVFGIDDTFALALVAYVWLAVLFYLFVALLILEIPRALVNKAVAPDPERRLLLARGAAISAGLVAAGVTGYGIRTALGPPQLKRVQIPLAKLPRSLDGYRIALVSDIHLGPLTGVKHTQRIVDAINGMNADLVAVVGDLVDGSVEELRDEAAPLRGLVSKDGAYFVTGNHEYYSGVEEWLTEVDDLGMKVLRNQRLDIRGLDLAGVEDVTGNPDYRKALGDRDTSKPVILLAHQPVAAHEAAKFGVDLQLSGHTHGGQMVPFNLLVKLQQPMVSGLGDVDGTKVYVTNGAGFWGPPVRVGAPPDITLVELRAR